MIQMANLNLGKEGGLPVTIMVPDLTHPLTSLDELRNQ